MNITSLSIKYNLQDEINKASVIIYPVTVILTVITNIFNICVLCRRKLRLCSCTYYFLAFALTSLIYACEVPVMMFLRLRFGFAVTLSPIGCRLQTFIIFILPLFISIMLVFASVDRYFTSSSLVKMRNMSQVHIARQIIIMTAILNIIYMIPFMFIYHFDDNMNQCLSYSSTIALVYLSSRIILSYILVPLAMIIFGFLTIHNIRTQTHRIAPIILNPQRLNRRRRTEGQLTRMLIIQLSAYVLLSTPAGIAYTLVTFIKEMNTPFMIQLRIIFNLCQQSIYFLSFFLYILSSTTYRQEVKHMLKFNHFRHQLSYHVTQFIRKYVITFTANDSHV